MAEPEAAEHRVVAPLVEEELAPVPQADVHLAVPVDVRRAAEAARLAVQVEDGALADVDEEPDVALAPMTKNFNLAKGKKKKTQIKRIS